MNSAVIRKKRITILLTQLSYPGKIRSLTDSSCPAFFPASAAADGERIHLYYSVEGYQPLRMYQNLSAEDILQTAKSVLQNISCCRQWLWFPGEYVLSADTVWRNGQGSVRFLCIPDRKEAGGRNWFCGFLRSMRQCTGETGCNYLLQLVSAAQSENLTPAGLLSEIDRMLAEVRSYSPYRSI